MKKLNRLSVVATVAIVAGLAAMPLAAVRADQGFNPDTGQINAGHNAVPSNGQTRAIPSQEEARAALMTPNTGAISTGEQAATSGAADGATTGAADANRPVGPIGSQQQSMPAKFSQRNDILDRVPTMAWPLKLDEAARRRIFEAVMADSTKAIAASDNLAPAHSLSVEQTFNAVHPLPPSLGDITVLNGLSYVKTSNEVFLVRPETRTIVDRIGQS